MAYSTFGEKRVDNTVQPMFFGTPVNVARYDRVKYDEFNDLTTRQLAFFWRPEEIDLSIDRVDFNQHMQEHERHIFTSNLKYQTLLDSVQGRALVLALMKITSLPELENWIETWSFSETIHSRSYSHIIRNLVADPDIIFNDIVENKYISERARSVTDRYDRFIKMVDEYSHAEDLTMFDLKTMKRDLYLLLVDINALEALRFYVSFACSFAFAERELMEGNAKIIKLIARDEALHKEGTVTILRLLRTSEDADFRAIANDPEVHKEIDLIYASIVQQESEWADYLFKDGAMIGLNATIVKQYMQWVADINLRLIGRPAMFGIKSNPLPWMSNYTNSSDVQVAPQETELTSYRTADLAADTHGADLDVEL